MDDSTRAAVLEEVRAELERLWETLTGAAELDLERAEGAVRDGMLAIGARLLEATVAAHGTGKAGARSPCPCGGQARFEGYRAKGVQTVVGWITLRRAYYACVNCGHGHCPLDAAVGLRRDSLSPGVRRLVGQLGALLPFAEAGRTLADTARVTVSASTVRTVTEALGAQRETELAGAIAAAWTQGLPPAPGTAPERLIVAMDGIRILGTDGSGHEVKVGVVQPIPGVGTAARQGRASYVAGLEPAVAFGPRLALEAHRRGLEGAQRVAVLGDGAAWIWTLAEEYFPGALHIVDWFHASERIWALGRALFGEGTSETTTWVEHQLDRLAQGQAATLAAEWAALPTRGEAAAVRDEQVTYFTGQARRMAYDQYRAAGWDIGSGIVESACKQVVAAREKGPGMRWSEAGAHTVAAVRVLVLNNQWHDYALAS
jgi:hypothetical protein